MRMLRAISEIAAAITVWSPLEKPASAARSRPRCRAVTTSVSAVIGIRRSSATVDASRPALDAELRLLDRKSTRLNSSHGYISYAVFCLKKKKNNINYKITKHG